jgi:7-keto-8-aminopelargonate synthetase-like enzyme
MPLPAAAAARAAGWLIQRDAAMRERLRVNVARLNSGAAAAGLRSRDEAAPILAVVPRSAAEASRLRRELLSRDIYPSLIRYSDGPSSGYFRFAVSSEHDADQVGALIGVITPKETVGSSPTI